MGLLWRERVQVSATATSLTVRSRPLDGCTRARLAAVAVEDSTTAGASALVGVESAGRIMPLARFATLAAGVPQAALPDVVIGADERVRVDLASVTSGDVIVVSLLGEKEVEA